MRNRYGAAVSSDSEIGLLRRFAPVVVNELELRQIAESDHLTGASTRRTWTTRAIAEIARSHRYGRALSRATLDLDHFKLINDTHRHAVGGKVIKRLACLCMSTVRQSHLFARFGGEEFVLIMPETNVAESLLASERLRTMFANATDHAAGPVACTVSIGIAGLAACNANPDALLHVIGCGR